MKVQFHTLATIMLWSLIAVAAPPARAQDLEVGQQTFRQACASCHGVAGYGNGELAPFLTLAPTDLTTLARDNGGAYPALDVYRVIDGRELVNAHGARAMPVWGALFSTESTYGPYTGETAVQARVLELVYFIESLQRD